MKCRVTIIKTDTLPGGQLGALREGKTYSFRLTHDIPYTVFSIQNSLWDISERSLTMMAMMPVMLVTLTMMLMMLMMAHNQPALFMMWKN